MPIRHPGEIPLDRRMYKFEIHRHVDRRHKLKHDCHRLTVIGGFQDPTSWYSCPCIVLLLEYRLD